MGVTLMFTCRQAKLIQMIERTRFELMKDEGGHGQMRNLDFYGMEAKSEDETSGNVVDVSSFFKFLKTFKSEFDEADISLQGEILKDFIYRIEVLQNGVRVKIYGVKSGIYLENPLQKNPAVSRSGVLPAFGLVELPGFEPGNPTCHAGMIPTSS